MAAYELFQKEFSFRGRHAKMASELWALNDYEHTYFKRLMDLYTIAAVVGFRADRKVEEDYAPFEPKKIFPEQMLKAKEDLDFILQMMIMLDTNTQDSNEEIVKKAFKGAATKEEYDALQNMFNSYVRGGVEELYERLIIHKPDTDDDFYDEKTANLMGVMERFTPIQMKINQEEME